MISMIGTVSILDIHYKHKIFKSLNLLILKSSNLRFFLIFKSLTLIPKILLLKGSPYRLLEQLQCDARAPFLGLIITTYY